MIPAKKLLSILILLFGLTVFTAHAQPGVDDPPDNPPVPISGIGYLLALGGALGIKKIYDLRKRNNLK